MGTKEMTVKTTNFSKDNQVVELSSKQNQVQTQNVVLPERPKEKRGD